MKPGLWISRAVESLLPVVKPDKSATHGASGSIHQEATGNGSIQAATTGPNSPIIIQSQQEAWNDTIEKIERITFKVSIGDNRGTGFVVQAHDGRLVIATAWHVIKSLAEIEDKWARHVKLFSASDTTTIEANAVAMVRLGTEASDIGLLWVGNALSQKAVDDILKALDASDIKGGTADLSGGGGVITFSGTRKAIEPSDIPALLPRKEVTQGMELGWLGYPSVASNSACFFPGTLAGNAKSLPLYLIDGTVLSGLSGGPVFDNQGRIIGIVSRYKSDEPTQSGLVTAAPVSAIIKMLAAYE